MKKTNDIGSAFLRRTGRAGSGSQFLSSAA
jgi:hypothetical protein